MLFLEINFESSCTKDSELARTRTHALLQSAKTDNQGNKLIQRTHTDAFLQSAKTDSEVNQRKTTAHSDHNLQVVTREEEGKKKVIKSRERRLFIFLNTKFKI